MINLKAFKSSGFASDGTRGDFELDIETAGKF